MYISSASGAPRALVVVKTVHNPEPCLIGIDADNGMAAAPEALSKIAEIEELMVPIGTVGGGEFLAIDAQGIAHLMEQAAHRVRTDADAEIAQSQGHFGAGSAGPLQAGDGIAGSIVFEQEFDQGDDVGGFFSTGLRPPPERRVRPGVTS